MTAHVGHLLVHMFTFWHPVRGTLHSGLVSVASSPWAIVSLASAGRGRAGGAVREFCSELMGCGSDTSRHRESSVPQLRGRGAGKRWHRGVMKKCLCVRGLKNSPFRVVRLLAEQRQGPVSEICCKDYLVWILYQGTAKQEPPFFFLPLFFCAWIWLSHPSSEKGVFLFCCIPPAGPRLSPLSVSLHSSSNLSLPSKNASFSFLQNTNK